MASSDLAPAITALARAIEHLATAIYANNETASTAIRGDGKEGTTGSPSDLPSSPGPSPWTKPGHWCTPERKAFLRKAYPSPEHTPASMQAALAAYDGPSLPSWDNIGSYCLNVLKIRRPRPPAPSTAPIVVDATTLRAKAATWGIVWNLSRDAPEALLALVNEKAARIGHPPFELQQRFR